MYIAEIKNNLTGEIIEYETINDNIYIWEEGNYSCDCNREIFFCSAAGEPEPDDDIPCTDYKFSVNLIDKTNNKVLYQEFKNNQRERSDKLNELGIE